MPAFAYSTILTASKSLKAYFTHDMLQSKESNSIFSDFSYSWAQVTENQEPINCPYCLPFTLQSISE